MGNTPTRPRVNPSGWLEVALTVDGELAEAVADVLNRFVPGGVVIESTQVQADQYDQGQAIGPLRVCGYLPVDAELEYKRQQLVEALWYLGRIQPLPEPVYKTIQEVDWAESWKQHFQPILIGKRLLLIPDWLNMEEANRITVRINPGMAFGTGSHPTTQICLLAIEELLTSLIRFPQKGSSVDFTSETNANLPTQHQLQNNVIDIGCGSGILAIAALKLGAGSALGVDTDTQAVQVAAENAAINGVAERLELGLGSVIEVRAGKFHLEQAPLVVANILAPVLVDLLEQGLIELITPGGHLLLSGILEEQAHTVETACHAHGLKTAKRYQSGDWVALVVNK